jgi:hypothetical protein
MVGFLSTCKHSTSSSTMCHVIIHYVPCHHPLYAMSSSTKSHIYVLNRFSVAYSMYITPRVYKRILPCNIFGVTIFTFHLKILFKKFSQERAGYHLVCHYRRSSFSQCAGAVGTRDAWGRPGLLGGAKNAMDRWTADAAGTSSRRTHTRQGGGLGQGYALVRVFVVQDGSWEQANDIHGRIQLTHILLLHCPVVRWLASCWICREWSDARGSRR